MTDDKFTALLLLERYFAAIDARDWATVSDCFTHDSVSSYGMAAGPFHGGKAVAEFISRTLEGCDSTLHALGNWVLKVEGDTALIESHAVVSLHFSAKGLVSTRGIRYRDTARRADGRWCFTGRVHEPLWQVDSPTVTPRIN